MDTATAFATGNPGTLLASIYSLGPGASTPLPADLSVLLWLPLLLVVAVLAILLLALMFSGHAKTVARPRAMRGAVRRRPTRRAPALPAGRPALLALRDIAPTR